MQMLDAHLFDVLKQMDDFLRMQVTPQRSRVFNDVLFQVLMVEPFEEKDLFER